MDSGRHAVAFQLRHESGQAFAGVLRGRLVDLRGGHDDHGEVDHADGEFGDVEEHDPAGLGAGEGGGLRDDARGDGREINRRKNGLHAKILPGARADGNVAAPGARRQSAAGVISRGGGFDAKFRQGAEHEEVVRAVAVRCLLRRRPAGRRGGQAGARRERSAAETAAWRGARRRLGGVGGMHGWRGGEHPSRAGHRGEIKSPSGVAPEGRKSW